MASANPPSGPSVFRSSAIPSRFPAVTLRATGTSNTASPSLAIPSRPCCFLMAAPTAFSARARCGLTLRGLTISRRVFLMPSALVRSTPTGNWALLRTPIFACAVLRASNLSCSCRSFRRPSASTTRITSIACIRSSWRPPISLSLVRFAIQAWETSAALWAASPPRSRRTSGGSRYGQPGGGYSYRHGVHHGPDANADNYIQRHWRHRRVFHLRLLLHHHTESHDGRAQPEAFCFCGMLDPERCSRYTLQRSEYQYDGRLHRHLYCAVGLPLSDHA